MQELAAKSRTELGKKTKALRRAGLLPAVVYGESVQSEAVAVSARDFEKVYQEAGESSIFTLAVDGGKKLNVKINDVAYDPLTLKPIHADFYSVRMDKEIETKVPLVFTGESPAVKNEGGVLVKVMHEIEVRALPKDLPHEVVIDTIRLENTGDRIYVKDIAKMPRVEIRADADDVIVLVEAPRSEEEIAAAETEAAPSAEEVKTEAEIKREERAVEETTPEEAAKT